MSSLKKNIAIIDYGFGNLLSIKKAVEHLNYKTCVTNNSEEISKSSHIILPGVGSFDKAMLSLKKLDLIQSIKEYANKKKPMLGICLGMQLLFTESKENKKTKGLNLINGKVIKISAKKNNITLKVPHVGWSQLIISNKKKSFKILKKVKSGIHVYFIHSYFVKLKKNDDNISYCNYGSTKIPAIVQHGNIVGCQFHPEKSGKNGLKLLKNFLEI